MANSSYGYQGFKGYQYETSPRKLQPEFEPQVRQKTTKKAKVSYEKEEKKQYKKEKSKTVITKKELKSKMALVLYIMFGFALLFTVSYRNSVINEKFTAKEALKTELAEINKENEQLEVALENELNLSNVEQMAKEKIGMSKLDVSQKVYVELPKQEYIESNSNSVGNSYSQNLFEQFVSSVKKFIKY